MAITMAQYCTYTVTVYIQYMCIYIYILMYPHFMDQSFVFVRSLCNLDFHTLSRPVT